MFLNFVGIFENEISFQNKKRKTEHQNLLPSHFLIFSHLFSRAKELVEGRLSKMRDFYSNKDFENFATMSMKGWVDF